MSIMSFLFLLSAFSVITGLIVEAVKKYISDKENRNYNTIALIVALVVGLIGTFIYYEFNGIPITMTNIIFAILMGFASALAAMVGYDKVKSVIEQLK